MCRELNSLNLLVIISKHLVFPLVGLVAILKECGCGSQSLLQVQTSALKSNVFCHGREKRELKWVESLLNET